jgi:hypothetical protein
VASNSQIFENARVIVCCVSGLEMDKAENSGRDCVGAKAGRHRLSPHLQSTL